MSDDRHEWPELTYAEWAPTKKTMQICAQMLGKARVALSPPQPEWLHTCLYLDPRGLTTGAIPVGARVVSMRIDVFASSIVVDVSDGRSVSIPLGEGRCVADIWARFSAALAELGVEADIWEKPQELTDTTLFSANRHDCTFDASQAQTFHRVLSAIDGVFEEFRSEFFGRTGVQFWWGAFDFAVLLFTGKHEIAPDDRGYIMRYDLDAEHLNAGFWPGDDSAPTPSFYAYIHPRPDGCETARIEPEHAGWVDAMGEWMMPYDAVRTSDDPRSTLLTFLRSVYRVAVDKGGWDERAFRYTKPPRSRD